MPKLTKELKKKAAQFFAGEKAVKSPISEISDEYIKLLQDGSIGKTMKELFKMDKHHLFTPFKMGFYCAVIIGRKKCPKNCTKKP